MRPGSAMLPYSNFYWQHLRWRIPALNGFHCAMLLHSFASIAPCSASDGPLIFLGFMSGGRRFLCVPGNPMCCAGGASPVCRARSGPAVRRAGPGCHPETHPKTLIQIQAKLGLVCKPLIGGAWLRSAFLSGAVRVTLGCGMHMGQRPRRKARQVGVPGKGCVGCLCL